MKTAPQGRVAPGPRRTSILGHALIFQRDPISFLTEISRAYGDVARFQLGRKEAFFFSSPEYVKEILVTHHGHHHKGAKLQRYKRTLGDGLITSEGDLHRRQRRLCQPAFQRQRLALYGRQIVDLAARVAADWRDGATVDLTGEMTRLALMVAGKTLFDADVESDAEAIREAIRVIVDNFTAVPTPWTMVEERLRLPRVRRVEAARERLNASVYRIIRERRARGEDRGDLLSMLMAAQDTEGDGAGMTDVLLRDELMTFLLAGFETTASSLTWAWYLLAKHPDVEARLRAELASVLGGRAPTFEDVPKLAYTERVFQEALRLYPPAFVMTRRVVKEYAIDGYTIPAGSHVFLSQYVMHHDGRYYDDPFRFDPDRWAPEAKAGRPRYAYFPFGGGPRQCIGEAFAWLEGVLMIATIAQGWRMRIVDDRPVELQQRTILKPKVGVKMALERCAGGAA